MNYNTEHRDKTFQFDFLNDDINIHSHLNQFTNLKLPNALTNDLRENKPIIFFINPPFGTANVEGAMGGADQAQGMALTRINSMMLEDGYGDSAQQLYTQFLYRILKFKIDFNLSNVNICTFANPLFLTGVSFRNFRRRFFHHFKFEKGMLFNASHFSDVSDDWGISFSIWKTGEINDPENFSHDVKEVINGRIIVSGNKIFYNLDNQITGSDFAKGDYRIRYGNMAIDYPQLTSPINIKQVGTLRGRFIVNSLGYYNNGGNSIYQSEGQVGIYSSCFSNGNGYSIMPEYFNNIISNFMARRLGFSTESWKNQKDEFMAPNIHHPEYSQWLNDALVFTVFNPKAKVSSLRRIEYRNNLYNITNEFFFISLDEIRELANSHGNNSVFNDIKSFQNERFLYSSLLGATLSDEASNVYEFAKNLVKDTFQYRDELAEDFPKYHLNTWDAGWFQLKFIVERQIPNQLREFESLYRILFEKWKPYIYEFGFLKR